jgi:hypothetical protein
MARGRATFDSGSGAEHLCTYVADISAELHRLARGCELTVLACLLNLVNAEAERQARERRNYPKPN